MSAYHVRLVLEWLQARPHAERTTERLSQIVAHIATVYALPLDERAALAADAHTEAQQRGLLPPP
jgi:hypothetical protein